MLNGRFEIEHEIGSGAMGTVFKGLDTRSDQAVAIKRLKSELISPAMLERFRREGEALHQLNHPNIVKFVDTFEDEGQHYLVLEYIDGANLKDTIQQTTLDVPKIIDISLGIADALTRAHFLNILHRDIKPANILIGKDGGVYLTDFGVAAFAEMPDLTETDGVVGTIPYLSPEILEGRSVSEKSDIWAFGIVLYETLTGERPFQGDHAGTLMRAILFDDVPDLEAITDGVPIALIDLVYRMLEKDAMFRIPSVRLVGVELEALKKGYVPYTPRQLKRDDPSTAIVESRFSTPTPTRHILHNLPTALTPFVGRESELKELERLISTERLISIIAPGGMGKTRVALEAASGQLGQWTDGVYFVDLAPISSSDAIPGKIAEATGFQFYEGVEPREQILSFLREKQMLLLMDNFEHLLDGVDMVGDILQTASDVSIIITSRERLQLQGETLFTITGMEFPDWETPKDALEYAAVKLFLQSARRTSPAFKLLDEDLTYISRICRLVNGMPLGILLAASWLNILTPEEIAGEIEQSLDFLETDQRNVPERQRSIRGVFDHSWNRLSQREQDIFAAMSVFRGGFTREAAQAVTGAGLRDLVSLVNKSMIARQPDGRYAIHELMRQYVAQKLSEKPQFERQVNDEHCRHYLNFLAEREEALQDGRQFAAMRELEPETENWNRAWMYGVDQRIDDAVGAALWSLTLYFWNLSSNHKLSGPIQYAIDKVDGQLLGRLLTRSFYFLYDIEKEREYLKQALEILDHPGTSSKDMVLLMGTCGVTLRDETLVKRALQIASEHDDRWLQALALSAERDYAANSGDFDTALVAAYGVLQSLDELDNQIISIASHRFASAVESAAGNRDKAIELSRHAIKMCRELGLDRELAPNLNHLANSLAVRGEYEEAIKLVQESLELYRYQGNRSGIYEAADTYGQFLYKSGNYQAAQRLFVECVEIAKSEFPTWPKHKAFMANRLGFVDLHTGNPERSKQQFVNALNYMDGVEEALNQNRLNSLIGLAHAMYAEGNLQRSMFLLQVVDQYLLDPTMDNYVEEACDLTAKLEAELSPGEIETARQQAESYDLDSLIEELLAEHSEAD